MMNKNELKSNAKLKIKSKQQYTANIIVSVSNIDIVNQQNKLTPFGPRFLLDRNCEGSSEGLCSIAQYDPLKRLTNKLLYKNCT